VVLVVVVLGAGTVIDVAVVVCLDYHFNTIFCCLATAFIANSYMVTRSSTSTHRAKKKREGSCS
jgi:hypothetical protein